jgi:site-specific DNA recombinase
LQRRQGFLCGEKADWINDFSTTFDRVDGFLQINEEEAQVVRLIFDWYTKHVWGFKRITSELNRRNIKPRERKEWQMTSVQRLIQRS